MHIIRTEIHVKSKFVNINISSVVIGKVQYLYATWDTRVI